MTDSRNLAERLAAMRARRRTIDHDRQFAAFARSIPLLSALEQAGETYAVGGYGKLTGSLNAWAHDPDGVPFAASDVAVVDHRNREPAVAAALQRCQEIDAEDPVVVILRSEAIVLDLRLRQIHRFLPALVRSGEGAEMAFAFADEGMLEVRRGQLAWGRLP